MEEPQPVKHVKLDTLSSLKSFTQVVADTGDFREIQEYAPEDSTTNPSLILQAANKESYQWLITSAIESGIEALKTRKNKPKKKEEVVPYDIKTLSEEDRKILI